MENELRARILNQLLQRAEINRLWLPANGGGPLPWSADKAKLKIPSNDRFIKTRRPNHTELSKFNLNPLLMKINLIGIV